MRYWIRSSFGEVLAWNLTTRREPKVMKTAEKKERDFSLVLVRPFPNHPLCNNDNNRAGVFQHCDFFFLVARSASQASSLPCCRQSSIGGIPKPHQYVEIHRVT